MRFRTQEGIMSRMSLRYRILMRGFVHFDKAPSEDVIDRVIARMIMDGWIIPVIE